MNVSSTATAPQSLLSSSIGIKVLMAVSGLCLWLFLVAHMAGNLTIFAGKASFNAYAAALHARPLILWVVRAGLIFMFPLHIVSAVLAAMADRRARPIDYAYPSRTPVRLAARSMLISGFAILAFLLYHLAHFTWNITGPMPAEHDPYAMVVMGFQNPVIATLYIVAQILLAAHLSHGLYAVFQHLGVWGNRLTARVHLGAKIVGYGMCAAFCTTPLAVLLGWIS